MKDSPITVGIMVVGWILLVILLVRVFMWSMENHPTIETNQKDYIAGCTPKTIYEKCDVYGINNNN